MKKKKRKNIKTINNNYDLLQLDTKEKTGKKKIIENKNKKSIKKRKRKRKKKEKKRREGTI